MITLGNLGHLRNTVYVNKYINFINPLPSRSRGFIPGRGQDGFDDMLLKKRRKQKHTAHQFSIAIYQLITSIVIIGINIKSHVAD